MLKIFSRAAEYPMEFIFCIVLAMIPTLVWIFIFNKKYRERKSAIVVSFLLGMGSAMIVLLYQFYWGREFNLGFFYIEPVNFQTNINSNIAHPIIASLLIFLSVGFLEEYSKHWVVKGMHGKFFRSIDDVIEISIVAALGFAFLENIGYFFQMVLRGEVHNLVGLFVMRSIFVVFIHILCSGLYGYFYGVSYFSNVVFNENEECKKKCSLPNILHYLFHFKRERVFHDEMVSLGLIVAVFLHGFYDFILDVNLSLGNIMGIQFLDGFMLHQLVLPVFLVFGIYYLNHLIEKREDRKIFGKKVINEEFEIPEEITTLNIEDKKESELDKALAKSGLKERFYRNY